MRPAEVSGAQRADALQAPPLEQGPEGRSGAPLRTRLREHFGGWAVLAPQRGPTTAPLYLQPCTEPGVWCHDLPPLATIQGIIVVTDAGATPAGMAMAIRASDPVGRQSPFCTAS